MTEERERCGRTQIWARVATTALLLGAVSPVLAIDVRPIRFDRLTPENGLSQSTVLRVFQDSRGFIWLGTEDGLNRYDGYTFTVYHSDETDRFALVNDFIWAIDEDRDGNIWVATDGGGIAMWDRDRDQFVVHRADPTSPAGLSSNNVRALRVARNGTIWIGTRGGGLDRFDPASGRFSHLRHDPSDPASLSHDNVSAIIEDRKGRIWVGTDAGLDVFDPVFGRFMPSLTGGTPALSLRGERIRSLLEDRFGAIWAGAYDGGLAQLDVSTRRLTRYRTDAGDPKSLSHDRVRALLEDSDGRIWVGTTGGLNVLDRSSGVFTRYLKDPLNPTSLSDNEVMSLAEDRGKVLWVGTRTGGVNKWNPATWSFGHHSTSGEDPSGLSSNNITSFSVDGRGRLWVGTFGGGLNLIARHSAEVKHFRHDPKRTSSLSDDRVMALLSDGRGALWIGTLEGGLNRFDSGTEAVTVFRHDPTDPRSLGANGVMSLLEDTRGTLWVGTYGGGLNRFDRETRTFTRFTSVAGDPTSISNNRVTCMAEDPAGVLWVGTELGLNRFDPNTRVFQRFGQGGDYPPTLGNATVLSLLVEPSGTVWVGTRGGGLIAMEPPGEARPRAVFRTFTQRTGLPNDAIYGVERDDAGHLWMSTNNGLACLDSKSLTIKNFDVSHGLQGNEFNVGAHYASSSGELFFGGINGFNAFLPGRLRSNAHIPPVVLTAILKFNKPVDFDRDTAELREIALSYRDTVVSFDFAALDFAAPARNRYAYRLEGSDTGWIDLGTVRRATFTNLSPGNYVLRVTATNNDGVRNEDGLALAIEVIPPPWMTWWAKAIYALLGAGAFVVAARTLRAKSRREAEYSRKLEHEVEARTGELAERNEQLTEANRKLAEASLTDSLTGLRNRRFVFEELGRDLALAQRMKHVVDGGVAVGEPFHLFVMVDLDDFKAINDTFGHPAGDQVLVEARAVMEKACRASDILVRWGGDEFLVVGFFTDPQKAEAVVERIWRMVARHAFSVGNSQVVYTTCSIGFAGYPFIPAEPDFITWEQTVAIADRALYVAKKSSRNAWVGFIGKTAGTNYGSGLFRMIQESPDRLYEEGVIDVRTSIAQSAGLIWV